jgi:hypothetical protein
MRLINIVTVKVMKKVIFRIYAIYKRRMIKQEYNKRYVKIKYARPYNFILLLFV